MLEVDDKARVCNGSFLGAIVTIAEPCYQIQLPDGSFASISGADLEPIPPTDSELRQRLLDAGFEFDGEHYYSIMLPNKVIMNVRLECPFIYFGEFDTELEPTSAESAVILAICIKKVTGVE